MVLIEEQIDAKLVMINSSPDVYRKARENFCELTSDELMMAADWKEREVITIESDKYDLDRYVAYAVLRMLSDEPRKQWRVTLSGSISEKSENACFVFPSRLRVKEILGKFGFWLEDSNVFGGRYELLTTIKVFSDAADFTVAYDKL